MGIPEGHPGVVNRQPCQLPRTPGPPPRKTPELTHQPAAPESHIGCRLAHTPRGTPKHEPRCPRKQGLLLLPPARIAPRLQAHQNHKSGTRPTQRFPLACNGCLCSPHPPFGNSAHPPDLLRSRGCCKSRNGWGLVPTWSCRAPSHPTATPGPTPRAHPLARSVPTNRAKETRLLRQS